MDGLYDNKYRTDTVRASWHDYRNGAYFITICADKRIHYFGEITEQNIELTELGDFLTADLMNISSHYPFAEIPLFVVMSNHIHAIIFIDVQSSIDTEPDADKNHMKIVAGRRSPLALVISGFKRAVTRYANQHGIPFKWQDRYYDHIIRNQKEMNLIADYIENNVARWEEDIFNTTK